MQTAIKAYLDFVYKLRSPKTHRTYQDALQTFVDVVGNDAQLTKDTYIKFLLDTASMTPSTQALCRSAIKGLYYYTADTVGGVDTSFFYQSDRHYALKPKKSIIKLNEAGIQQVIDYVNTIRSNPEDLRDRTYILLLADSGLRVSEACGLRVGDVDLLEERAFITGKGDKEAFVKISHRVADAMRDYLRTRTVSKSSHVFIRHDKRAGDKVIAASPGYMWHYIKRRITEAGVDPESIRPHDFRHYFVTTVYRAKGIKAAQVWARHERIDTTNRYTHLVEDDGAAYDEVFNH
jgi:integrase/recombinase XerC